MKNILALALIASIILSSCATFNIHEAASFKHSCPSKHLKRLHKYGGKYYFSLNLKQNSETAV